MPEVTSKYTSEDYGSANPDWHASTSPWKAKQVLRVLDGRDIETLCEVGCGAGAILREIHDQRPEIRRIVGYDIAPKALEIASRLATPRLSFHLGDAADDPETFDAMLIMDVVEHVENPIGFLSSLRPKAKLALFHIPLEISVQSVLRPHRLTVDRERLGHIHQFTPETALATVRDGGFEVIDSFYTRGFDLPQRSLKAKLARVPRNILPPAITVRWLGGYSLLVVAVPVSS